LRIRHCWRRNMTYQQTLLHSGAGRASRYVDTAALFSSPWRRLVESSDVIPAKSTDTDARPNRRGNETFFFNKNWRGSCHDVAGSPRNCAVLSVSVMALLMLVLGSLSFAYMNIDIFPAINLPVVMMVWNYPGLSPFDGAAGW